MSLPIHCPLGKISKVWRGVALRVDLDVIAATLRFGHMD